MSIRSSRTMKRKFSPSVSSAAVNAYKSSKSRQKLHYLRITEALQLDPNIFDAVEYLALYAVLNSIEEECQENRGKKTEASGILLSNTTSPESSVESQIENYRTQEKDNPCHSRELTESPREQLVTPIHSTKSSILQPQTTLHLTPTPSPTFHTPQTHSSVFSTPCEPNPVRLSFSEDYSFQKVHTQSSSARGSLKRKRNSVTQGLRTLLEHIQEIEYAESEILTPKRRRTQESKPPHSTVPHAAVPSPTETNGPCGSSRLNQNHDISTTGAQGDPLEEAQSPATSFLLPSATTTVHNPSSVPHLEQPESHVPLRADNTAPVMVHTLIANVVGAPPLEHSRAPMIFEQGHARSEEACDARAVVTQQESSGVPASKQPKTSFVDANLSSLELRTAADIGNAHMTFLSEHVETDCTAHPVGYKDTRLVDTLQNDPSVQCATQELFPLIPPLEPQCTVHVGELKFSLGKHLGKGSYAQVFELGNSALKIQHPACPWEYYVMKEIHARAGIQESGKFIAPHGCTLFQNASLIKMEYHQESHSLLDVINAYRAQNTKMPELVAMYYVTQLSHTLHTLHHSCNMIHGDFKADNVLVCYTDKDDALPCTKLIDFGRSIDLDLVSGDEANDNPCGSSFCMELLSNTPLPWSFNLDYLYLVETVHLLLFAEYPQKPYPNKEAFLRLVESKIPRYFRKQLWTRLLAYLVNHVHNGGIEEANPSTNLLVFSEEFSQAIYPKHKLKLHSLMRAERRMVKEALK